MLDPQTYRASERLAKSLLPHWRVAQTHNLDHFERAGFPVRIDSVRELGPIIDSMQENRFTSYMNELGGLSEAERALVLDMCRDAVRFQLTYLPHRPPVLPISTLLSVLTIYKKLRGINENFSSVLEIGPGCGYLSFVLKHHAPLQNYSQIEACESFYILQNLVNLHCFGPLCDERALPHENTPALDYYAAEGPLSEFSPRVSADRWRPRSTHYPWWRIGELVSRDAMFDVVTSNANLLEFNETALADYLSLIHRVLSPAGALLVQCTGYPAQGTDETLLGKMREKGFAPLLFVQPNKPVKCPRSGASDLAATLEEGTLPTVAFNVTNALFIKAGHPLFERYYEKKYYHLHFVAPEPIIRNTYFDRPPGRRFATAEEFVEETERTLFD
jgi:SAM-dependent methyltransferase